MTTARTPKISIVMSVRNAEGTVSDAIKSYRRQTYAKKELIVVDGASTDNTVSAIGEFGSAVDVLLSEPDDGLYHALNKGLRLTTGEYVGILHADDYFADEYVLEDVAKILEKSDKASILYADLDYVSSRDTRNVVRRWRSSKFSPHLLKFGWMPAHPTLFVHKDIIAELGVYDTRFRISSDYEYVWRLFREKTFPKYYLSRTTVKMRIGGMSNKSIRAILAKSKEDFLILRFYRNSVLLGLATLVLKNVSKLRQFSPLQNMKKSINT